MAFADQYAKSVDAVFKGRVRMAMAKVAKAVSGEVQGGKTLEQWRKRAALATQVLQDPDSWVDKFSYAVCTNQAVVDDDRDTNLEIELTATWDDMAGVTGKDLT